jgi:hypothetical protein
VVAVVVVVVLRHQPRLGFGWGPLAQGKIGTVELYDVLGPRAREGWEILI